MTLEEVIKHAEEVAVTSCDECRMGSCKSTYRC